MSKVNKRNSSEPLSEGDLLELECVAYNSKPPANISWFSGSDSIEQLADPTSVNQPASAASNYWPAQQRQRHKRLLQRNQVHLNPDGLTFNTHSFLSIRLTRHEHKTQISCHAQNGPKRPPLVKSLELKVQRKFLRLIEMRLVDLSSNYSGCTRKMLQLC